jgi:hypothetical protein
MAAPGQPRLATFVKVRARRLQRPLPAGAPCAVWQAHCLTHRESAPLQVRPAGHEELWARSTRSSATIKEARHEAAGRVLLLLAARGEVQAAELPAALQQLVVQLVE